LKVETSINIGYRKHVINMVIQSM